MRKKVIIVISMILLSEAVSATDKIKGKVEKIRVRDWITYIKIEGCNKYSRISLNDEYGKAKYSAALSAASAGLEVEVKFKENDACTLNESELEYIDVIYR
ncbi:hypothetical protein [Endozoicomonas arenosclerae]|uniref:hypothetical protein n=1 Tax=Endozoicomonas arenosclerae TaxID=1633495 RepID=UPI00078255FE|nr:hypothetical protein [Endozoicomonas arenosclerae]